MSHLILPSIYVFSSSHKGGPEGRANVGIPLLGKTEFIQLSIPTHAQIYHIPVKRASARGKKAPAQCLKMKDAGEPLRIIVVPTVTLIV